MLVYNHEPAEERSEFAPAELLTTTARDDLLARVERRMLDRDDEDLAIEQLPAAGRTDDPEVAGSHVHAAEPPQQRRAALPQPTPPATATSARLRELRKRVEQLQAQLQALPTQQLQRIEDLDARALTVGTQRDRLAERLAELPQPRRRFGREQDLHAVERAHLTSALSTGERELEALLAQRTRLARELGEPAERA